jgi:predicted ATPase with chaperone activity
MRLHRPLILPLVAAVIGLGGFAAAGTASAQTQPRPEQSDQSANISDQKLDAAAAAIRRVARLKEDYQQRLAETPEPDRERVVQEANDALEKAVTDQGLSLDEYTSILSVARTNPGVREKILQRLQAPGAR